MSIEDLGHGDQWPEEPSWPSGFWIVLAFLFVVVLIGGRCSLHITVNSTSLDAGTEDILIPPPMGG